MFFKREEEYWRYMADDYNETCQDAKAIKDLDFKEFKSGGESVADYAPNIFLYWDLWIDYLADDSFLKYGWLDVERPVLHETNYRADQAYSTIWLVSFLLIYLGYFNFCIFYLLFVIAWHCYDEENDHDLYNDKIVDPALDLYINLRSQWRAYLKKMRHWNDVTKVMKATPAWKTYWALVKAPNDIFYLDNLPQIQAWKILSTQSLKRVTKVPKRRLRRAKNYSSNFLRFYSQGISKAILTSHKKSGRISLYKKNSRGLRILPNAKGDLPKILAAHFMLIISGRNEKYALINDGKIASAHKAFDFELHILDAYARHWYYFKAEEPFRRKNDFYLL